MSSSKGGNTCEICAQTKLPNWFCIDCYSTFCTECWAQERAHAPGKLNRDGIAHEKHRSKEVVIRLMEIFTPADTPKKQRKLHKTDAGSKWFGVTSDGSEPILQDYGRYSSIMRESPTGDSPRWPQLVSFVGQTGAGKSTLVKALIDYQERIKNIQDIDHFPSPVAGSANAHAPTSGDVHLYVDPGTHDTRYPALFADCEGMDGGEMVPMGAQQKQIDELLARRFSDATPLALKTSHIGPKKLLRGINRGSKHVITWATNPEKSKREFAVKNLYPRILYAFSDIVVFVLRNDRIFESAALIPLLQWADSSVESSINQSAMPHVIIVLNFADPTIDSAGWTVESATNSLLSTYANAVCENAHVKTLATLWQERGKVIKTTRDLLECYYSSTTVIRVPQKGRYGLVDSQISELSSQIERRCGEARENRKRFRIRFDAEEFQQALFMGFDHFATRLDEPLDFVGISCKSNPIPEDFAGNILRLALAIKDDLKMVGKTGPAIFQHLGHMVASCIMLDFVRHDIKGTPDRVILHYKESYCRALKSFCERFWPCAFTYKGIRCVNTRSGHVKGHQDAHGWIMFTGPYLDTPGFTEQAFEEEWHVMLQSNLDNTRVRMSRKMRGEIGMEEQQAAESLHLERINEFYSNLGDLSAYMNHAACFCCLRELPEHPLPCGHVLCTPCIRSFACRRNKVTYALGWCPLHRHERWDEEWEITVKPDLAGIRLLTLDGGGIRGIVELKVLAEIQKHLGQLQLANFFDLIVGTSTGGIIAVGLGVKDWTIEECTSKFEKLCSTAFTPRFASTLQRVASVFLNRSKYKAEPFNHILRENFGEDRLFGGKSEERRYRRKVAVVSTYGTGQEAVIMTNYNRLQRGLEPDYKFERPAIAFDEMRIWEACRATSAAPTFFKPFCNPRTGLSYIDGAVYYNNPARVAHQERKLLWPNTECQAPDIMLSIGSSSTPGTKHDRDAPNTDTRLYRAAMHRFDNIFDSQNAWDQFEQEVREPYEKLNSRYIRLNPEMKSKTRLDDLNSLEELKRNAEECLKSNKWVVDTRNVARRLIASSFFFERDSSSEENEIQGYICCRFPDESEELRTLGRHFRYLSSRQFSPYFLIAEEGDEHGPVLIISKDVIAAMIYESTFKVDRLTVCPSSKSVRTTISLYLSKDDESFPISGFPRHLMSEILPNGRLRRKHDFEAKHGPSQVTGRGKHTRNEKSMEFSTEPLGSSETLPFCYIQEEIPFWARGFSRSRPNLREDSTVLPRAAPDTGATKCCDSLLDGTSEKPSKIPRENHSKQVDNIQGQADQQEGGQPARESQHSGTPPRSLQNSSPGSIFEQNDLRPMRAATNFTPRRTQEFVDDHIGKQDMRDSLLSSKRSAMTDDNITRGSMESAQQELSKASRAQACRPRQPLGINIPTTVPSNTVPQSATTPRSMKRIAYPVRHEGGGMARALPISELNVFHSVSNYDMRGDDIIPHFQPRSWRPYQREEDIPPVPAISPCAITDMTDEEIFEIARMRSLKLC